MRGWPNSFMNPLIVTTLIMHSEDHINNYTNTYFGINRANMPTQYSHLQYRDLYSVM